jgi:hypothetical protein
LFVVGCPLHWKHLQRTADNGQLTSMHTIRLRGPWEVEVIARFVPQSDGTYASTSEQLPRAGRATMPADWSEMVGADFLGRVRYRRKFNKPTGLQFGNRVWLVIEPPRSSAYIVWKGDLVGSIHPGDPPGRFDITRRLGDHNEVDVFVDHPHLDHMQSTVGDPTHLPPGGLVGEVRLEIED